VKEPWLEPKQFKFTIINLIMRNMHYIIALIFVSAFLAGCLEGGTLSGNAIAERDPTICQKGSNQSEIDDCLNTYATSLNDPAACGMMSQGQRASCYTSVAQSTYNSTICNFIQDQNGRAECNARVIAAQLINSTAQTASQVGNIVNTVESWFGLDPRSKCESSCRSQTQPCDDQCKKSYSGDLQNCNSMADQNEKDACMQQADKTRGWCLNTYCPGNLDKCMEWCAQSNGTGHIIQ
jgi:hypothetical protein